MHVCELHCIWMHFSAFCMCCISGICCIFMHSRPPLFAFSTAAFFDLAVCAFRCILWPAAFWIWCILTHYNAFSESASCWCIRDVVHTQRGVFWRIVTHCAYMHFYAFLTRRIYAYCSACWFRCILIQLHFNAFARLTSSDAFRLHSPSEAHRVHAACFLVSLALSPLGFSCVCLCGPHEPGAFVRILTHVGVF